MPSDPTRRAARQQATLGATVGIGKASLSLRLPRARVRGHDRHVAGRRLRLSRSPDFGSDFTFWRVGAGVEHGVRFFKSHNLIVERRRDVREEPAVLDGEHRGRAEPARLPVPAVPRRQPGRRRTSSTTSRCSRSARSISARWLLRRPGDLVPQPAARPGTGMYATRDTPDAAHLPASTRQRLAEQGLPARPRHPPGGRRRAALLPSLGRGAADRVRRRLRHRVPTPGASR